MGYSKDLTERRYIRLTPEQAEKWDQKGVEGIRKYLDYKTPGRKRKRGRR